MISLNQVLALIFSIFCALGLMTIHLPYQWQWLRPEWLSLVLIYWVFARPQLVGVGVAWLAGFVMDILGDVLLGQYAMAMAIVVYFTHLLRHRVRLFPLWQQAFVVIVLVGFGQLSLLTIQWLIGHPPRTIMYWSSTLTSALFWPFAYYFLKTNDRHAPRFR